MRNKFLVPAVAAAVLALAFSALGAESDLAKYHLKPGAYGKLCSNCHVTFQEKLKKPYVHTPVKEGVCTGCHSPHAAKHSKLLAEEKTKICIVCHSDVVPDKPKSVHPPVAEGGCVKCHDPHSANNAKNLVAAGNELCFGCHTELGKRIAAEKFRHPPVAKGCLSCHDPHASTKGEFILRSPVPELCVKCHKTDAPNFQRQHMNYPVAKANCTSCHDPHGSNRVGILYDSVHRPVMNKMCDQCHEGAGSATPLKTRRTGYELCRSCHSDAVNKVLEKKRMHWPVLSGKGCLSCHNPHAGSGPKLMRGSLVSVCGSCHSDTMKRQDHSLTKHPPVQEGKCVACHDPHGSDNPFFFTKPSVPDLCGSCHDYQKHSTHPIGEKYRDPRNRNLSVQCLSCHRSHGTEYKHFIPYATTSELCTQCHDQYKR